jgi:hypothetical protein
MKKPMISIFLPPLVFFLPGSIGILMRPSPHSPEHAFGFKVFLVFFWGFSEHRKGWHLPVGLLKEPVVPQARRSLLAGGCGMRCGAVAC